MVKAVLNQMSCNQRVQEVTSERRIVVVTFNITSKSCQIPTKNEEELKYRAMSVQFLFDVGKLYWTAVNYTP